MSTVFGDYIVFFLCINFLVFCYEKRTAQIASCVTETKFEFYTSVQGYITQILVALDQYFCHDKLWLLLSTAPKITGNKQKEHKHQKRN